jgi:hypothetical protein
VTAASVLQGRSDGRALRRFAYTLGLDMDGTASVLDKDGHMICALVLAPRRSENLQIQKPFVVQLALAMAAPPCAALLRTRL